MSSVAPPPVSATLVLVPRFPLLSLACCTEAFRLANRESGRIAIEWRIATDGGAPLESSSGLRLAPDLALQEVRRTDVVVLLSAYEPAKGASRPLLAWLRRMDRAGALIATVDTAALLLGQAGLLGPEPVVVHQEVAPAAGALVDAPLALDRRHLIGPRRASSAGGAATLDLALTLIARLESADLARRVAAVLNHAWNESGFGPPAAPATAALQRVEPRLARMIEAMAARLAAPSSMAEIAAAAGVPIATAQRLARRHLGVSLGAYAMRLRLEHGRGLLIDTHLSIGAVAEACGFASSASFARAFRARYGTAPSALRPRPSA